MRYSVLVPEERARLSGTSLKIIACVFMLISHIIASGVWIQTAGLLPVKWETVSALYTTGSILQLTVGRIAFPIFGFLLVEGAQKTHNKKRYLDWLGIGVLVLEIPFDLALFGTLHDEQHRASMQRSCLRSWPFSAFRKRRRWNRSGSAGFAPSY